MVFSGIFFLFYFLPCILILYYLSSKRHKNIVLFVGSLFFYAWGEPVYVVLMLLSILFNFYCGLQIENAQEQKKKKTILTVSVIVNLASLVFFKYTNFLLGLVNSVLPVDIPLVSITLPIGISFYTFQAMSYVVDVYRKNVSAQKKIILFGTYVALFPQLIAGPIVRYSTIEQQLEHRRETIEGFTSGIICFTVGLAKKVLLANNIGVLWDSIHTTPIGELSVLSAWLGIVAFAFQIYFDFSGYSDMAIGLGRMFGFEFEQNFHYPYLATSITDFWHRWHISLSTWFKEYVYIPLGGNRVKPARLCLNIFVVWALTGLWHGASLNFLAWGVYYAILLMIEKFVFAKGKRKLPGALGIAFTFFFVLIGWVFFASNTLTESVAYLGVMFGASQAGVVTPIFLYDLLSNLVLFVACVVASTPFMARWGRQYLERSPSYATIPVAIGILICTAYLVNSSYNPFLYFRF